MKKRLLSNTVRNAILMAVLLQSIIFGIGLLLTGTFSSTADRPYKVMESQVEDKNSFLSGHMNNLLLLANNMDKELAGVEDQAEVQCMLEDGLNHVSMADGLFYLDLDNREALVLRDGEPDISSATYGDITCLVGQPRGRNSIALSQNWYPKLSGQEWDVIEEYWNRRKDGGTWLFSNDRLFYILSQEIGGDRRLMGMEVSRERLDSYLRLDHPPYEGMAILLLTDESVLYSQDKSFDGQEYRYDEKTGHISLDKGGESYDGVRSTLKTYGYMYEGAVYVASVCYDSELAAMSRATILMVAGVYLLSIIIAIIFSYVAIGMVLKPLQRLQKDIARQKPEEVHFKECGIVEIDKIHEALNHMAERLEQTYSRYSFTMESGGKNVGTFEYQEEGGRVRVSPSVWRLLNIPAESREPVNEMGYEQWSAVLNSLERIEELEDGYAFTDIYGDRRAVTIRHQREEHGVFGLVIDKTDAYREIMRLRNISQHDQLTGLYNSAYLKKEGQKILDENRKKVNALVFCDLDNLKHINDNYGHEMGDRYLMAMADMLTSMAKGEQCLAVRLSGDEFILFFYGYDDRESIEEKVREGYGKRPSLRLPDGTDHRINASVGLAYAQREAESMDALLNRADRAMYRVKHGEKNGIAIYDKSDEAGPA